MTIFADASALVAMIAQEIEAVTFADCLDTDPRRVCSALSAWETVAGLMRSYTQRQRRERGSICSSMRWTSASSASVNPNLRLQRKPMLASARADMRPR
jgi:uncharacterized protein with PIN domain